MESQTTEQNLSPSRFVSQSDAAKYLRCSRTKFYTLRKQYQIPHYRHGGLLYFAKADLDAYFMSLKATLPAIAGKTKIYLMKDLDTGATKIGRSNNPNRREKTLLSAKSTIKLFVWFEGTYEDERNLHKQFAEQRIRGEWFDLSDEDIDVIIREQRDIHHVA